MPLDPFIRYISHKTGTAVDRVVPSPCTKRLPLRFAKLPLDRQGLQRDSKVLEGQTQYMRFNQHEA